MPIEERARERKERTERGIERQRGERREKEGRKRGGPGYLRLVSDWDLAGNIGVGRTVKCLRHSLSSHKLQMYFDITFSKGE